MRKKSQDTAEQLNMNNVEKFKTANRQRTDILDLVNIFISSYHHIAISISVPKHLHRHIPHHHDKVSSRVSCDVLVITGAKSRMVEAGDAIHRLG